MVYTKAKRVIITLILPVEWCLLSFLSSCNIFSSLSLPPHPSSLLFLLSQPVLLYFYYFILKFLELTVNFLPKL